MTHYKPAGMQRFNNVLSTSVQSHDVASTLISQYYNVVCLLRNPQRLVYAQIQYVCLHDF